MEQYRNFGVAVVVSAFLFFGNTMADNATDAGSCSNHCSQQDKDDSCWNKTQQYYDVNLINVLNDWMIVQVQVDQWNHRHTDRTSPPSNFNETTISRLEQYLPAGSILDLAHLQEIVPILLDMVFPKSSSLPESGIGMPEFVCPIPCGYDSHLWQYLFVASVLVNIAMLLVVIPFIIKSERRDKKLYAKQVSMMQMLKPSKSRNPSSS